MSYAATLGFGAILSTEIDEIYARFCQMANTKFFMGYVSASI